MEQDQEQCLSRRKMEKGTRTKLDKDRKWNGKMLEWSNHKKEIMFPIRKNYGLPPMSLSSSALPSNLKEKASSPRFRITSNFFDFGLSLNKEKNV